MLREELYMKYPFFASFLVLCAVFYHNRKKADRNSEKIMRDFFDRENEANNTRKQPLDNLDYISIPFDSFPVDILSDDPIITECISDIKRLMEESIVNFTGQYITDLKLQYGPANLPFLQRCDFNYSSLVTALHRWAKKLYEENYHKEALTLCEYAISIKADVSGIYYMAADIYIENGCPSKIEKLITVAESLNSAMKNSIIKGLKEKM